jgi:nitrous oxidase accessory protein
LIDFIYLQNPQTSVPKLAKEERKMKSNKLTVCALIVLLSLSTVISLSMPANAADMWTDITPSNFPYTITTSGNYRITDPYTGAGLLVNITVPNVVLDGQNYLLTQTGDSDDRTIMINENCTNVLVKNINEVGAQIGLASVAGNFTVQDCVFANNTGGGILAFNVTGFTIQRCILSNSSNGFVGDYTNNFTLKDCILNNNTQYGADSYNWTNASIENCAFNNNSDTGLNGLGITNLSIKNSVFNNNTEFSAICYIGTNVSIDNCNFNNGDVGFIGTGIANLSVKNSVFNNNTDMAFANGSGNLTLSNCTMNFNRFGVYLEGCDASTISNSNINYNTRAGGVFMICNTTLVDTNALNNNEMGLVFEACNNTQLSRCNIQNSGADWEGALSLWECNSTRVSDSNISNNLVGIFCMSDETGLSELDVTNSRFINNSYYSIGAQFIRNCTLINNYFGDNCQIDDTEVSCAVLIVDANSTVAGNRFVNNTVGFMWANWYNANTTQIYRDNSFQNNTYTMAILNGANSTSQQFYFYNNLVNDTNYISPLSFVGIGDIESQHAPPSSAFHLNCTMQAGTRVYSNGGMIGGNYWAHPNGTGPSQTGTDANKDGFLDTPFELFGNATFGTAYDSLPYSSSYVATLTYTAGKNQTIAANQVSAVITVQLSDLFGNTAYATTINLSSNSTTGKFYSNSAATMQITSLTIPAGSNTASFYYKDSTACTPVITAASTVAPSAATYFTITAHSDTVDHIAISPTNQTVTAGQTVNYTTTAYDAYGNSWVASGASYLIDGNSISSNVFSVSYPGTYVVTVVYSDKTDATYLTVTTGGLSRFIVSVPSSVTVDRSFAIQIVAVDASGNVVSGFGDTVSLSASGTTINPTTSGSFTSGTWRGNVTLADIGSFKIFADGGSGHNGTSTTITVNAPSTNPTSTPRPATPTPTPSTGPSESGIDFVWLVVVAVIVFVGVLAIVVFIMKRGKP